MSAARNRIVDALTAADGNGLSLLLSIIVLLAADGTVVAMQSRASQEAVAAAALAVPALPAAVPPATLDPAAPQPWLGGPPTPPVAPPPAATPEPAPAPAPQPAQPVLTSAQPRLATFTGLSTWVDTYDDELAPHEQAGRAAAGGADAIYVQSARFNSPADIHDPARLAALIEAAHDRGMRVMVWYIPDFVDPQRDLRRAQAAVAFVTPRGDRADAFGLDIEMEDVPDVAERSRRLLELSAALRAWVGPDYPMAAVVLPPLQLDRRPSWWPAFPYAELRAHYDVFIPMSYTSFRGTDPDTTYLLNLQNVLELRRRAGDPNLPVHLAGGIADRLHSLDAFVAAARDGVVVGAGLYDLHTTHPESWPALQALRAPGH